MNNNEALIEEMRKAKVRLQGISISGEMDIAVVDHAKASLSEGIKALEQSDAEIAELKGMLKVARCPNTTCSDGILCVGPEIEPCQWCYEVSQFINPIGDSK